MPLSKAMIFLDQDDIDGLKNHYEKYTSFFDTDASFLEYFFRTAVRANAYKCIKYSMVEFTKHIKEKRIISILVEESCDCRKKELFSYIIDNYPTEANLFNSLKCAIEYKNEDFIKLVMDKNVSLDRFIDISISHKIPSIYNNFIGTFDTSRKVEFLKKVAKSSRWEIVDKLLKDNDILESLSVETKVYLLKNIVRSRNADTIIKILNLFDEQVNIQQNSSDILKTAIMINQSDLFDYLTKKGIIENIDKNEYNDLLSFALKKKKRVSYDILLKIKGDKGLDNYKLTKESIRKNMFDVSVKNGIVDGCSDNEKVDLIDKFYQKNGRFNSIIRNIFDDQSFSMKNVSPERIRVLLNNIIEKNCSDIEIFLSRNLNPDITIKDGQTLLHYAAMYNDTALAKLLIQYNCNINVIDIFGNTPLDIITYIGNKEFENILIARNARTNNTVVDDNKVENIYVDEYYTENLDNKPEKKIKEKLWSAFSENNYFEIKMILSYKDSLKFINTRGCTPLIDYI